MSPLQRMRSRPLVIGGACAVVILAATVADAARAAGRASGTGGRGHIQPGPAPPSSSVPTR